MTDELLRSESKDEGFLALVEDDKGDYASKQILSIEDDLEHGSLRQEIVDLQESVDRDRWELAGRLHYVYENKIHTKKGFPTWEKYVRDEVHMSTRTASFLRTIFVYFSQTLADQIEDDEERSAMVEELRSLGWSKASCLVGVCTADNYQDWFALAQKMTVSDLSNETKLALVEQSGGDPDEAPATHKKSFSFSEGQLDVVEQALEIAGKSADSNKKSHLLSLVCQTFVADNMAQGDDREQNRNKMLTRIAAEYGVDLIAVDPGSKKILMGIDLFNKLREAFAE